HALDLSGVVVDLCAHVARCSSGGAPAGNVRLARRPRRGHRGAFRSDLRHARELRLGHRWIRRPALYFAFSRIRASHAVRGPGIAARRSADAGALFPGADASEGTVRQLAGPTASLRWRGTPRIALLPVRTGLSGRLALSTR